MRTGALPRLVLGRGGLTRKDRDLLKNIWGEAHICWTVKMQFGFSLLEGPIRFDIEYDFFVVLQNWDHFWERPKETPYYQLPCFRLFPAFDIKKKILLRTVQNDQ